MAIRTVNEPGSQDSPCHAQQRLTIALLMVFLIVSLTKETAVIEMVSSRHRSTAITFGIPLANANSSRAATNLLRNNVTAGFIHIGKTGGSTLASVIRNSCHSFMRGKNGKCRGKKSSIENESIASELVTAYYHGKYGRMNRRRVVSSDTEAECILITFLSYCTRQSLMSS